MTDNPWPRKRLHEAHREKPEEPFGEEQARGLIAPTAVYLEGHVPA